MSDLRRDLGGLTVKGPEGEARIPVGGFIKMDGTMEVRFVYRDQHREIPGFAPDTNPEDIAAAILALLPGIDEELMLAALVGVEV